MDDRDTENNMVRCPACHRRVRLSAVTMEPPRCAACRSPLPWLTKAVDVDFERALQCPRPVLIHFWSHGQGLSRSAALGEVACHLAGRLKVVSVDVDDAPRAAAQFAVSSVPSFFLTRDGLVIIGHVGTMPVDRLFAWVKHTFSLGSPMR